MKEYFLAVLASSVLSSVCVSLVSGTPFEKYIKYVCSLVCAAVLVLPFAGLVEDADLPVTEYSFASVSVPDEKASGIAADFAEESVKAYVSGILEEKFGIIPYDVRIEIDTGDGITAGGLTVTLCGSDGGLRDEAEDFLYSVLGGGVKVICNE